MGEKTFKIFVVEDNDWYNKLLVHHLSLNPDYEVESFFNARDFLKELNRTPDVVTLDYRLPDMLGMDVLKRIKEENEDIQVILISEQDDIQVVVELLKHGAYDYIVKSNDIRERLINTVSNIRKGETLKKEVNHLRKEVQKKYSFQNSIVGNSEAIKKIFYGLIDKATRTNITVSISGETGTGKELVAKAIHYNSNRCNKPFVAVNLAAIPSELIESELFGHEKGAFTGASFQRTGKFEEANGGTLFLDEVAEMELSLQAKMLRALQEKEITRVGSNKSIRFDSRIIVATHKNLLEEVNKGTYRQDLYYRLLGLPIELPPLRDRGNDILILAKFFVHQFCEENGMQQKSLSTKALNKLLGYTYPGNIRELKSLMELAVTLADEDEITDENIILNNAATIPDIQNGNMTLREYEMRIVQSYLQKYNNNTKLVAEKLDIGIATIYRMLKEWKQN
ncbi:MAG: sigma-54-dependent Fis family transcriptional regulator [Bacteroidales bacterium]|nr:sigma-54-dependent Fis family transcriptional regulator [Bacteroidales bacterium]